MREVSRFSALPPSKPPPLMISGVWVALSWQEPHHQNDHHHYEGYKETVNQYKDYPLPPDLTFLKGDYK